MMRLNKVLIANRGEIACRVIRTCRRLGLKTVAVYSEADQQALHVELADEAYPIGAAPATDSYLRIDAVCEAVVKSGADAVHPGYGLLSENALFAGAVAKTGARFVGPSPSALEALGDKVTARAMAQKAGLPAPPGTAEPLIEGQSPLSEAERLGYPVLVKAALGGGGIGMEIVPSAQTLDAAVTRCRGRSQAAFGDGRVYLEKYFLTSRHIEMQALRDSAGRTLCLGERECSVQRRHQKVIEESPSPAGLFEGTAGTERRAALVAAIARLLSACDYVGAATIELIVSGNDVYFLEVNARLQVEHPVTELTHDVDLVELQLALASGNALAEDVAKRRCEGHAIEVRVCAEDPHKGFLPQPGQLTECRLPVGEGIRVDSGVRAGDRVTPYYDSLLMKVIAFGDTREQARLRLLHALNDTKLTLMGPKGERQTNLRFLELVLRSDAFISGDYDTGIIGRLRS